MKRFVIIMLSVAALAAVSGCGGGSGSSQTQQTSGGSPPPSTPASTPAPAPAETSVVLAASLYDGGPRAGQGRVDAAQATTGEKLFQTKGCVVCHGFGKKVTCPDLVGVSMRRTASWMEHQILHPEVMVKEDPISHELRTHYAVPMTNQGLTPEEARAVIEFLKKKDRDAGVKAGK
jgi:mono/diheme cytochrome c family protein